MTASTLAERLAGSDTRSNHGPFLDSHRATAACRRERDRLHGELARQLSELLAAGTGEAFDVRVSPDRWIVQLGPVSLTVVWLKGARDSIAEGELLVIVWHGVAGRRPSRLPERPGAPQLPSATALWEEVLVPVAADEATWGWQPRSAGAGAGAWPSPELAARCVERLHAAYARIAAAPKVGGQP